MIGCMRSINDVISLSIISSSASGMSLMSTSLKIASSTPTYEAPRSHRDT